MTEQTPQDRSNKGTAGITGEPDRILIVAPNWVGDLVMATPALRAIRQRYLDARITLLLRSHLIEVVNGGDWMNDTIAWPPKSGRSKSQRRKSFLGFAAEVREQRFDWAVLLTNSFRSALLARLAGIPKRIGYDRDGRGLLLTDRLLAPRDENGFIPSPMIGYYNGLARYLGCRSCPTQVELFTTAEEETAAEQSIARAGVRSGQRIVVINAAASFGAAKCWIPERFGEVADRLIDSHDVAVFFVCGPNELPLARKIVGDMKHDAYIMADPTPSLGVNKALIRRSALLITNDTGPRHFGNAFAIPTITIFGPTFPEWTDGDYPIEQIIRVDVDCGPCMKRRCPLDHRCMTLITTEMVYDQATTFLEEHTTAPAGS